MSYAYRRPYTHTGPITFADVQACSPPPGWTQAHEHYHRLAWQTRTRQATQEALTSAEEWRKRFGRTM